MHLVHVADLVGALDVNVLNAPLEKYLVLGHGTYHNVHHARMANTFLVIIALVVLLVNTNHILVKLVAIRVVVGLIQVLDLQVALIVWQGNTQGVRLVIVYLAKVEHIVILLVVAPAKYVQQESTQRMEQATVQIVCLDFTRVYQDSLVVRDVQ